ncbi:MAG: beta-N-acetylhexosaminidase [Coxiellaceae bacterium]|nr:beta-N-acetylhexosaminidase [Coxiellaceae bacterium]
MQHGFLWVDLEGLSLTPEDRDILEHPAISGLILFSRNYESSEQLCELTQAIQKSFPHIIITVDQEGGRVQRFREGFTELPSMQYWGEQYFSNAEKTKLAFSKMLRVMIEELKNKGVYSSLVPVLDINYGKSEVIGHRSFGDSPEAVTTLASFMIDQCHQLKMPVTGKHFPGHGFVTADSHLELPIDERSLEEILNFDIQPFSRLASKLDAIMLAHVVYAQVDENPVCFSPVWIKNILREQIQYDGLVISDDLSMKAVAQMGSYADRSVRALEAGCDVLLACNDRLGVVDILDYVPLKQCAHRARRLAHYGRFGV